MAACRVVGCKSVRDHVYAHKWIWRRVPPLSLISSGLRGHCRISCAYPSTLKRILIPLGTLRNEVGLLVPRSLSLLEIETSRAFLLVQGLLSTGEKRTEACNESRHRAAKSFPLYLVRLAPYVTAILHKAPRKVQTACDATPHPQTHCSRAVDSLLIARVVVEWLVLCRIHHGYSPTLVRFLVQVTSSRLDMISSQA